MIKMIDICVDIYGVMMLFQPHTHQSKVERQWIVQACIHNNKNRANIGKTTYEKKKNFFLRYSTAAAATSVVKTEIHIHSAHSFPTNTSFTVAAVLLPFAYTKCVYCRSWYENRSQAPTHIQHPNACTYKPDGLFFSSSSFTLLRIFCSTVSIKSTDTWISDNHDKNKILKNIIGTRLKILDTKRGQLLWYFTPQSPIPKWRFFSHHLLILVLFSSKILPK